MIADRQKSRRTQYIHRQTDTLITVLFSPIGGGVINTEVRRGIVQYGGRPYRHVLTVMSKRSEDGLSLEYRCKNVFYVFRRFLIFQTFFIF